MTHGLSARIGITLPDFVLDAAFDVPPGLTVLFGSSGAGKSLSLQAIAGLMPLSRGYITLEKHLLAAPDRGINVPARLRQIGFVPQHYALFPHLSVAENVVYALPPAHHPWDAAAHRRRGRRVAELLEMVRLPGYERRYPRQLSGGEQQRVALARALAADPLALLLDEPLAALDAPTRAAVQEDVRSVILRSGIPAVVVTHDLAEARTMAGRMVVLVRGTVAAQGDLREVLAAPLTDEVALLLGWRNVLPIADLTRDGATARIRLETGDLLTIAAPPPEAPVERLGLALNADRLALVPATADRSLRSHHAGFLSGMVRAVIDLGPTHLVSVALATPAGSVSITVTCSFREWTALGVVPGDSVRVEVPQAAARVLLRRSTAPRKESPDG